MLELTTKDTTKPVEIVPLFSIDGKEYGIPKDVDFALVLRALKQMRTADQTTVMGQLLEDLLGEEAYEALCNYKGLTAAQFKELIDVVNQFTMGALEEATGNS